MLERVTINMAEVGYSTLLVFVELLSCDTEQPSNVEEVPKKVTKALASLIIDPERTLNLLQDERLVLNYMPKY